MIISVVFDATFVCMKNNVCFCNTPAELKAQAFYNKMITRYRICCHEDHGAESTCSVCRALALH